MREGGDTLVQSLGDIKGLNVLDVGCGDGTTALPEAKRGANVLGVDIARNLVEAGNARAKAEGLYQPDVPRRRRVQTCRASPIESFDLVVSIFGAMFAPSPSMSRRKWCASPRRAAVS